MAGRARTLHVSYEYKEYADKVSDILSVTTHKFAEKFKAIAAGEIGIGAGSDAEAATLQEFFQTIKKLDQKQTVDGYSELTVAAMRDVLANAIKSLNDINGSKRRKLFPTGLTGDEFEQVLSALVIETINAALAVPISNTAELIGDANLGARSFRAGGQFASNKDLLNLPSEMAQSIANTAQDAVRKTLEKQLQTSKNGIATIKLKEPHQSNAKVDVSGIILCELTLNENHELANIARLLQTAAFSAKNYSLNYMKQQVADKAKESLQISDINLRLGASKLDTIFYALFGDIYPAPVVLSLLFYTLNTDNSNIKMKLNQLRFIYELTGYGQHYYKAGDVALEAKFESAIATVFKDAGYDKDPFRVNYFIWNNPDTNGDIYVRSAAGLITELWDTFTDTMVQEIQLSASHMLERKS